MKLFALLAFFALCLALAPAGARAADPKAVQRIRHPRSCLGCDLSGANLTKATLTAGSFHWTLFMGATLTPGRGSISRRGT